jgi:hypothetical protein
MRDDIVTRAFVRLLALGALLIAPTWTAAQQPTEAEMLEDQLKVIRGDITQRRDSALSTLIQLEGEQAKTFRSIVAEYDGELKKFGEGRRKLLMEYAKNYKNLSPEAAKDLAARSLALDDQRNALRRKTFERMAKEISPIVAVQFLQLQRQFETMADVKLATIVPLAGM